jgi:hypothetical protein
MHNELPDFGKLDAIQLGMVKMAPIKAPRLVCKYGPMIHDRVFVKNPVILIDRHKR